MRTVVERAGHVAVRCGDRQLTYAELDARSSRLARALAARGTRAGGRVAIMLPNSVEFIECLAATAKLEVASLTVNWHLRPDELAWVLADSGAEALVTHSRLADIVDAALAACGRAECAVLLVGDDDPERGYEPALAASGPEPVAYRFHTSWPVVYTSGTTGRPKGVVHGTMLDPALMAMAQDGLMTMWGYRPDDVHVVAGPLYHSGPGGYANTTLYSGGTVVLLEEWDPRRFLEAVDRHRATTTFLTPAHFIRILEVPRSERAGYDTSSLRHVIHAGAPCPVPVKRRIMDALPSAEIWELYGMSEGGATRVSPDDWRSRPGTVGLPWPGVEVRIVDPDTGVRRGPGEQGLIYVKPARGRFEYHNDPAKTSAAWTDDAFTVGDVGHLDDDGYLYITDRRTDMVIRAGVNLYPREVEEVLHRHPDVVDCAVFGVPDDRDGEHLRAVVEVRRSLASDDLEDWCRQHLDPYKCPSEIGFVDWLPRDPNGKVLKRHLREQAWAGEARAI